MTMGLAIAMAVQDKTTHQKTFGSNMTTTTLDINKDDKVIVIMQLAMAV